MDRFEPGVKKFFVIITLCMITLPILVYKIANCKEYLDLMSSSTPSNRIIVSGISAVVMVNIVIAVSMIIIYNRDIKQKNKIN